MNKRPVARAEHGNSVPAAQVSAGTPEDAWVEGPGPPAARMTSPRSQALAPKDWGGVKDISPHPALRGEGPGAGWWLTAALLVQLKQPRQNLVFGQQPGILLVSCD